MSILPIRGSIADGGSSVAWKKGKGKTEKGREAKQVLVFPSRDHASRCFDCRYRALSGRDVIIKGGQLSAGGVRQRLMASRRLSLKPSRTDNCNVLSQTKTTSHALAIRFSSLEVLDSHVDNNPSSLLSYDKLLAGLAVEGRPPTPLQRVVPRQAVIQLRDPSR